jgi:hypothetical protein
MGPVGCRVALTSLRNEMKAAFIRASSGSIVSSASRSVFVVMLFSLRFQELDKDTFLVGI